MKDITKLTLQVLSLKETGKNLLNSIQAVQENNKAKHLKQKKLENKLKERL